MLDPNRYSLNREGKPVTSEALEAKGASENSIKATQAALDNYLLKFCSALPASTAAIKRYIEWCVKKGYAPATISQRIALLGVWHKASGFTDPTDDSGVREALKGLRKDNEKPQSYAKPLGTNSLIALCRYFDSEIEKAVGFLADPGVDDCRPERARLLRATRDKALLLVGFWYAFRSDELVRLDLSRTTMVKAEDAPVQDAGMSLEIGLAYSKGDRDAKGSKRILHQFSDECALVCPVRACQAWMALRDEQSGPLFVGTTRWGETRSTPMASTALSRWLQKAMRDAGLQPEGYSSHSMRRGFATFAARHGASAGDIASWVRWKHLATAEKYIDRAAALPNRLLHGKTERQLANSARKALGG